jgi:hypothetical protein
VFVRLVVVFGFDALGWDLSTFRDVSFDVSRLGTSLGDAFPVSKLFCVLLSGGYFLKGNSVSS